MRLNEPQETTLERFQEMDKLGQKDHEGYADHHIAALSWTAARNEDKRKKTMKRFKKPLRFTPYSVI